MNYIVGSHTLIIFWSQSIVKFALISKRSIQLISTDTYSNHYFPTFLFVSDLVPVEFFSRRIIILLDVILNYQITKSLLDLPLHFKH